MLFLATKGEKKEEEGDVFSHYFISKIINTMQESN